MGKNTSPVVSEAFVQCPNCGGPIRIGATSCDGCQAGKKWDEAITIVPDGTEPHLTFLLFIVFLFVEGIFYFIRDNLKTSLSPDAFNSAFSLLFLGKVILLASIMHQYSKYQSRKKSQRDGA